MRFISQLRTLIGITFATLLFIVSCSTPNPSSIRKELDISQRQLDEIARLTQKETWIVPYLEPRGQKTSSWKLVHQKIWIRFNFTSSGVIGRTQLRLVSTQNTVFSVEIDAKKMDDVAVHLPLSNKNFKYEYSDSSMIKLSFEEPYQKNDTLIVDISYLAFPPPQIGLHFVDPLEIDELKPTQIWTLGQPEDNSFWLPTLDAPNQRSTHELWLSVPQKFSSFSNGRLISQTVIPEDSLRTDYWFMDLPSPPYLIAFAVGEFESTRKIHEDVVLEYVTQPQFVTYHSSIYGVTEKALTYFNDKFDLDYPWHVYRQIPVYEFAAGGMENTSATILTHTLEVNDKGKYGWDEQDLIVHELAHQWIGDVVTASDWAHLALHEGFANFSEYLLREHIQGKEYGQYLARQNLESYFRQAEKVRHPIQFDTYSDPYQLFDSHTYDKAARVLLMLRDLVGEETFWKAFNYFVNTHAFGSVDFYDFQKSFEMASNQSLGWFFYQWYRSVGHPNIELTYNHSTELLQIVAKQTQDLNRQPIFKVPLDFTVVDTLGTVQKAQFWMTSVDTTFTITLQNGIDYVVFDEKDILLAEVEEKLSDEWLLKRLSSNAGIVRYKALRNLFDNVEAATKGASKIRLMAKEDKFSFNRALALDYIRLHPISTDFSWATWFSPTNESSFEVREKAVIIAGFSKDSTDWWFIKSALED